MGKICMWMYCGLLKVQRAMKEERGAVDIVAIVVLIGIAVALAMLFKDQITTIMNNLFQNISDAASDATSTPSGPL